MDLFYHVVGLNGSKDFKKTVSKVWTWDEIEPALEMTEIEKNSLSAKIESRLGCSFNIWGVPAGAARTWKRLREGNSYVLLVTSISIHDNRIPFGGLIQTLLPGHQFALSELLWQSKHFPLIYFFRAEGISTTWHEFRDDLGYKENYRPPAWLQTVRSDRAGALSNGEGVESYLKSIRV